MPKQAIHTPDAPQPIGIYSQAIRAGNILYLSGQIGLDPRTMQLVEGIDSQIHQVFLNLRAVAAAAGRVARRCGQVHRVFTDMSHFARQRDHVRLRACTLSRRSAVAAAGLPRDALIEIEAILAPGV